MTETLDLIVIGAGMAGINAAKKCGRAGWSVAIVDELPYGGTCALRGMPTRRRCCAPVPRRWRPRDGSKARVSQGRPGSTGRR